MKFAEHLSCSTPPDAKFTHTKNCLKNVSGLHDYHHIPIKFLADIY